MNRKRYQYISVVIATVFITIVYISWSKKASASLCNCDLVFRQDYESGEMATFVDISQVANSFPNLKHIQDRMGPYSEMTLSEQQFVYSLLQAVKPKKMVEIGVAKGGSSVLMLAATQSNPTSHLYSIDTGIHCYSRRDKLVGFLVNESFPEYLDRWTLYTGVITADVIGEIGFGIDCVLIDTVHVTPGELLDFLQVLPFLSQNAVIILHDISLHLTTWGSASTPRQRQRLTFSNNLLYYYLRGKKILPNEGRDSILPNIGAVQLASNQNKFYFDYFFPLAVHWEYLPSEKDIHKLEVFFRQYYGKSYLQLFQEAIKQNRIYLSETNVSSWVSSLNRGYED